MILSKRMNDLTGQQFGSLTAIKPVKLNKQGSLIWEFKCVCGTFTEWVGNNVVVLAKKAINPQVPSCGCVRNARAIETSTTHGYSKHPLHTTWQAMKQRCYNPQHPLFAAYGAKGVRVCTEWVNSAEAFITWSLANGWAPGMHLDKDVLSDSQNVIRVYSPTTCQFIPSKENTKYSSSRSNFLHNPKIKLTPSDVLEIKNIYKKGELNQYELATKFNVTQASIWRAIHRS